MDKEEFGAISAAVLLLFLVISLEAILGGRFFMLGWYFLFAVIVIFVHVFGKKLAAYLLDSSASHRIWGVYRYGLKPHHHFHKELPFGLILPLLLSVITGGVFKMMTFLTYETRALKYRASKRFGFYSYTEMTDWHNGLIGTAGIVALLLLSFVSYFPGWEYLSKITAIYAFWNILPISNLDGTQIFFGSKIIWTVLALLCLVFGFYAIIL